MEGPTIGIKKKTISKAKSSEEKTFVCTLCKSLRERKHFLNGELVCRACYYKCNKADKKGKFCENCGLIANNAYFRSKFNERLCHNCFHYKLRNGVSRPLEIAPILISKTDSFHN